MSYGQKIVLGEYMSCGMTCYSGVHVFQGDIVWEHMSCRSACLAGVHVIRMAYLSG